MLEIESKWKRPGVYAVVCHTTQGHTKRFIGMSKNVFTRLQVMRSDLRAGTCNNLSLQAAYNQHGEHAFRFKVYQRTEDLAALKQSLIIYFRTSDTRYGFNSVEPGRLAHLALHCEPIEIVQQKLKSGTRAEKHKASKELILRTIRGLDLRSNQQRNSLSP